MINEPTLEGVNKFPVVGTSISPDGEQVIVLFTRPGAGQIIASTYPQSGDCNLDFDMGKFYPL